ncbi:hypothetical protein L9F63_020132 [Diploptera punctata]|uniref:Protein shuttle craft n=1 Tax=Diploptera punctata TaxID=6984 RepID=A0AAD7ZUQ4_DIPPU|nr:hypothetical protein L9F63_020132 [Diploptera punctata]
MASWNGSHPGDESIQNYNFIPPTYPENNLQSYPGNWSYYPQSQFTPVQYVGNDSLQQLRVPGYTNFPMQTNCTMPTTMQYPRLNQQLQDGVGNFNVDNEKNNTKFTVGESEREFKYVNVSNASTQNTGIQDKQTNLRRYGKYQPKHNSKPSSGQERVTTFTRHKGNSQGKSENSRPLSSDMSNMDRVKNEERERLLVEAAAFLLPSNSSEKESPSESLKKQNNIDMHANRVVTNSSKWKENSNGNQRSRANQFQKKRVNSAYNQQSGEGHYQRNNLDNNCEFNEGMAGKKAYFQSRSNNYNTGNSYYRTGMTQHSSPKSTGNFNGVYNTKVSTDDDSSQRERLAEQLSRSTLECLVCCERVRQHDPVWSCTNCYHVFHLKCIKKWAICSKAETGWRCPACQNVKDAVPLDYYCFCGKVRDPEWDRMDVPHSCGQMCGRIRTDGHPDCTHRCTLLCHPGSCPTCVAQVNRSCGCGKNTQTMKCSSVQPFLCGAECGKQLNCGIHQCKKPCHAGNCSDCEEKVILECYCGKVTKEVACTPDSLCESNFSCGGTCNKSKACGNHNCTLTCHPGFCPECDLTPDKVTRCPCGQTHLREDQKRDSCLDPVPTCDLKCNKKLQCGPPDDEHRCQLMCHSGPCPACPLITNVKCRCGSVYCEIACKDLPSEGSKATCKRRCTKKRSCGKHKCNQLCCIDEEHICPLPCNHQLSCGQHRCEQTCHPGRCLPCWRTSFEELYCECGSSVLYPPIPCGTRRPECNKPCTRQHLCNHPALHNCHSQPTCPPCTVLTQKYCFGKHELRKSIPCHQDEFSCGLPCNVALSCGRHNCILPCHKGPCLKEGQICVQPCTKPRSLCGHFCAAPCHSGSCPDIPCKEMVKVSCECGHRSTTRACCDNAKEYQRIATSLLASKMADMQLGHSIDIGDLHGNQSAKKLSLKTLECNDECKIIERNRRMAIGLQIRNPDLSAKLTPRYSDFMKQWAKKDPNFCNMVHEKLTELVQLAKQSKQKSRSYSFDSMNRDKRHFVHEYCEHFGCESVAYDQEPKRNVVATASRDKSWLPGMSLMEVIQRENGQRKIPKPVLTSTRVPSQRMVDILPVKNSQMQAATFAEKSAGVVPSVKACETEEEEEEVIDYFDFT